MEPQVPDEPPDHPEPSSPDPLIPCHPARLWVLALLAATLAGVGAFVIGELTLNHFVPRENLVKAMGQMLNAPTFEERSGAERKNASMAHGVLGAALGLALGLAGGLVRRSPKAALASGLAGALIGLGVGVATSEALLPFYFHQLDKDAEALSHDLILPLLVHGGIWAAIGAAGGASLALGLGFGRKKQIVSAVLAGLIGGALGAGAYEIIGAMAFSASRASEPLAADWVPRLIGKLSVTLLATALAVVAILSPGARKPAKP